MIEALSLDTIEAAQQLLGWKLIRTMPRGKIEGIVTETEAYLENDPASHSFRGQTSRNLAMFGEPGRAYIYFIYGNHHCLNVVTGKKGRGEAVLIRSLIVTSGEEIAKANRQNRLPLATGPGRLCQALVIDLALNGHDLSQPPLQLIPSNLDSKRKVIISTRIGISKATSLPYRFILVK